MTATQIGSLWGATGQAVGLWTKKEGCPRKRDGTYDLAAVIRWREGKLAAALADEKGKSKITGSRERLTDIKIESARFDLDVKKGLYCLKSDMDETLSRIGANFKGHVESKPRELATLLYGKKPPEMIHLLTVTFNEMLSKLSR